MSTVTYVLQTVYLNKIAWWTYLLIYFKICHVSLIYWADKKWGGGTGIVTLTLTSGPRVPNTCSPPDEHICPFISKPPMYVWLTAQSGQKMGYSDLDPRAPSLTFYRHLMITCNLKIPHVLITKQATKWDTLTDGQCKK